MFKKTFKKADHRSTRFFRLSPLYLPSDWHIPAWFCRVRESRPIGPCSSLERCCQLTERFINTRPDGEESSGTARPPLMGPFQRRASDRRRGTAPY